MSNSASKRTRATTEPLAVRWALILLALLF